MKSIVIITSRFPYPLEKGDKLRIYHQIKYLKAFFDIHLICLSKKEPERHFVEKMSKEVSSLNYFVLPLWKRIIGAFSGFFRGWPIQVSYFFSTSIHKEIKRLIQDLNPDIIHVHLLRMWPYATGNKHIITLDYMDAFSELAHQRILFAPFYQRWFWKRETQYLKDLELEIAQKANQTFIISGEESKRLPDKSVRKPAIISNGIDVNQFKNLHQEKEYDLIFVGNLSYQPNVIAVKKLIFEIIPSLAFKKHNVSLLICGADMPKYMKSWSDEYIEIKGWVDDLVGAYNSAKVLIAPIVSGSGMQNKVLEALSCELHVLTTSRVARSFDGLRDVIHVADTNLEFENATLEILKNLEKYKKKTLQGRKIVEEKYSWEAVNNNLLNELNKVISRK